MQPFLGTIMPVAFPNPPAGWALCNGQLMDIKQNQALFTLIGTTFGGNGTSNFALPDLRGRTPSSRLSGPIGVISGTESVTLQLSQMPSHTHAVNATSATGAAGRFTPPADKIFAKPDITTQSIFGAQTNPVYLAANNVGLDGSNAPHANMQPSLVLSYIIALAGIFPSQT